jgi:hypothetical protein
LETEAAFLRPSVSGRIPVWIEPKTLKKDIALEGMSGKLRLRFPRQESGVFGQI